MKKAVEERIIVERDVSLSLIDKDAYGISASLLQR